MPHRGHVNNNDNNDDEEEEEEDDLFLYSAYSSSL